MQSKNKRRQTASESAHVARVAAIECVLCGAAPVEVHEIKQGAWWLSCALCPDCHRGAVNGLHGQKRMWAVRKWDELDALAATLERVYG